MGVNGGERERERGGGSCGGGGDVSTDNKPLLICSPIGAVKPKKNLAVHLGS